MNKKTERENLEMILPNHDQFRKHVVYCVQRLHVHDVLSAETEYAAEDIGYCRRERGVLMRQVLISSLCVKVKLQMLATDQETCNHCDAFNSSCAHAACVKGRRPAAVKLI